MRKCCCNALIGCQNLHKARMRTEGQVASGLILFRKLQYVTNVGSAKQYKNAGKFHSVPKRHNKIRFFQQRPLPCLIISQKFFFLMVACSVVITNICKFKLQVNLTGKLQESMILFFHNFDPSQLNQIIYQATAAVCKTRIEGQATKNGDAEITI